MSNLHQDMCLIPKGATKNAIEWLIIQYATNVEQITKSIRIIFLFYLLIHLSTGAQTTTLETALKNMLNSEQ